MKFLLFIFFFFQILFSWAQKQDAFIKEGNELFKKGQLSMAIKEYEKITDPSLKPIALLNKGTAFFKLKDFDAALKTFNEASKADKANDNQKAIAFYNAGVVYSNQNKIEESIIAYKNALLLNWNDEDARKNLQKALMQRPKQQSGTGANPPPKEKQSRFSQNQAKQQLDRLEKKERKTQDRVSDKKSQNSSRNGKDW